MCKTLQLKDSVDFLSLYCMLILTNITNQSCSHYYFFLHHKPRLAALKEVIFHNHVRLKNTYELDKNSINLSLVISIVRVTSPSKIQYIQIF